MRTRYALISLVGLLTGCQSLCPLRHMQANPASANAPLTQAQPNITNMAPSAPLPLNQPAQQAISPRMQ
jgi:hypothetical protein